MEAQKILNELGMPDAQQNEIAAYTLLALCNLKESTSWKKAQRISLGISKGIMEFIKEHYNKEYAPNTRETFRRQVLHQFIQAGIVEYNPDNPDLPVNSPRAHYAISEQALNTVKSFKTKQWATSRNNFIKNIGKLKDKYNKERNLSRVPVKLPDGKVYNLSPGKHNILQKAVIEEFAVRFAKNSLLVYLGDTEDKSLYINHEILKQLGITLTEHSKLPDIVLYHKKKNWLYLIEVVTSHGPTSPKRVIEIEEILRNCKSGRIYVTAFPNFAEFKRHTGNIAWDTEVWVHEYPDHMIHFNGDRFIGPR